MEMLNEKILIENGASLLELPKKKIIFSEGNEPLYYYQIKSGKVKMYSELDNGTEFIQGVFCCNDSFGEAALFGNFNYPSSAMTMENSEIWKLKKNIFFDIIKNNFEIHRKFDTILSYKLQYKSMLLKDIMSSDSENRILSLIIYFKNVSLRKNEQTISIKGRKYYKFPFSRNELANMVGLRLETVIRYVKILEKKGKLSIINRKIYCIID